MNSNIQRLIRLLQQILEFRKAETGNLKLRVSPGDIADFVKRETESFQTAGEETKRYISLYFATRKLLSAISIQINWIRYYIICCLTLLNTIRKADLSK